MSDKTTSTQKATPFEPTIAPLTEGVGTATDLFNSGGFQINPYQGDWVANANPNTLAAQQGLVSTANAQAGGMGGTVRSLQDIASTDPGSFNFDFSQQRQNVIDSIMPAINGTFAGSGMTGSSLHQANLAKGLSSGLADAEMGFRNQEMAATQAAQQRQFQAASMLPGAMQAEFAPYQQILGVGNQMQAQEQAEIDALIQKDALSQGAEAMALQDYMALMSGVGGQFGSQTATETTRPGLLSILGAGSQIGGLFGG